MTDTLTQYKKLLRDGGVNVSSSTAQEVSGRIEDIKVATIDGNSNYFVKLAGNSSYYLLNILENKKAGILNVGDFVKFTVEASTDDIIPATLK